jgi:hypothetical protein
MPFFPFVKSDRHYSLYISHSALLPLRYGLLLSLRLPARSAVNGLCHCLPCNCGYTFYNLSRNSPPAGSLHSFESGQILNPCPHHYSTAFAFSSLPYLPACGLPLRVGFRICGDSQAYHVPLILHDDLGSAFPPGES